MSAALRRILIFVSALALIGCAQVREGADNWQVAAVVAIAACCIAAWFKGLDEPEGDL